MALNAEYYKSGLAVFGDTTKWKENLKVMGGKFNRNLGGKAGWIFFNETQGQPVQGSSKEQEVMQFIANANAGVVQPIPFAAYSPRQTAAAPAPMVAPGIPQPAMTPEAALERLLTTRPAAAEVTVSVPQRVNFPNRFQGADGVAYQVIVYTAPLPVVGQQVDLTLGQNILSYEVLELETEESPVDSILLKRTDIDETSRAVLTAGKWQIAGLMDSHTLSFH